MKINFFTVQKKFKKESFTIDPNVYWKFVIFLAFIVIFVSFGFSFYLFKDVKTEVNIKTGEYINNNKITKKESIEKVLEYFSIREKKSKDIINSELHIIDPSL